jgi:hypothetical protein
MMVQEDAVVRLDRMPNYIEVFTGKHPTQLEVDRFRARHLPRPVIRRGKPDQG